MTPTDPTTPEHLDVLIVGAGLSGIGAAHHLQTDCPWATYAIFEARRAIGGTWDLFRYPGIRSDSDMHTLGYSFRPWTGEKTIADGQSILDYIVDTAEEAGIDHHIRFGHRIVTADWSSADAHWVVTAETDAGETVTVTAGFLLSCSGYYRYDRGYVPDFPGMDDFTGQIVHPQSWPADLDVTGTRVVVIGSGATAVTLVPSLAATAGHVTMLQRSPTYMGSVPTRNPLAGAVRRVLPERAAGTTLRWVNALGTQGLYRMSRHRPDLVRKILIGRLRRDLPADFDVETHFTPSYDPWDQRLCAVADGDLFRALRKGTASVVTDHVDTFTATGIRLRSGAELEADIIVPATGLDLLFVGGIAVSIDGEALDLPSKLSYKGVMLEDVPNFANIFGYVNASWTLKADLSSDYVCRLLTHMRREGWRQATPTNDDPDVVAESFLGLSSGYVTRAADRIPKAGSKFPWQVHQSYVQDYRAIKMSKVTDSVVFSNPPRPTATTPDDHLVTT